MGHILYVQCCTENYDFLTYFEIIYSPDGVEPSKWDIYYIYGVFSGYIQHYTPSTSAFFRPRPAASDEKMPRFRGYIVGYTPQKHRIYITYIYIKKCPDKFLVGFKIWASWGVALTFFKITL